MMPLLPLFPPAGNLARAINTEMIWNEERIQGISAPFSLTRLGRGPDAQHGYGPVIRCKHA
jgi:hypothetical protein